MLVEFDHQIFSRARHGGVSRLFVEIARQFLHRPELGVEPYFRFPLARNDHLAGLAGHSVRHVPEGSRIDHRRLCGAVNKLWSRWPRRHLSGLLHVTYYNRRYLAAARGRPVVSTVYDMIPELHPELTMNPSAHEDKLDVLRSSDLVLCISETVRDDLDRIVGDLCAEVRVIPLGAQRLDELSALHNARRSDNRLIYVGTRTGYKCFSVLVSALTRLKDLHLDVLCVGGGSFTPSERAAIAALPAGIAVRQRALTDEELLAAYSQATVFVSTSLAEGFGLPAVEAMGAGCPVVLSDTRIHREIGGPDVAFVPVDDGGALSETLLGLLHNPCRRAELARQGWERSADYSWASTAASTAAAYHSIA